MFLFIIMKCCSNFLEGCYTMRQIITITTHKQLGENDTAIYEQVISLSE